MVRFGFSPGGRQSRKDRIEQAKREAEAEKSRRRNFGFLKNAADKRMSSTTLNKTREHAKELANAWSDPVDTPSSVNSGQGLLQTTDESFDPFGHNSSAQPQPSHQFSFSTGRMATNASGSLLDQPFATAASPEPTASTLDTFETASVGSAYDMDFFSPTQPTSPFPPTTVSSSARKPKMKSLDQFVDRSRTPSPGPGSYSGMYNDGSSARNSMPTFPSNSSMQSGFAKQSTSTAAARRRVRSHMRHSSNSSVGSSSLADDSSFHSGMATPPESPASSMRNGMPGSGSRNRLAAYQRPQTGSYFSAASSVGNSSNQSSSNRSGSEVNLFDSQNPDGGFTFDAFGLDQAQVEKEVNDAMHDLVGQGMQGFSVFFNNDTDGDFSSQGWDSPNTSRRSSPAPSDSETEGFVDGFRVSPSSNNRTANFSPASSERSFASPVSRRGFQAKAKDTITPPRWENSPEQGTKDVFGEPVSNPWKEDPWDSEEERKNLSDSGADSDFGGIQSEIVTASFPSQPLFDAAFPTSKSDVGISQYEKSVTFHKDVKSPRRMQESGHFEDDSSEESAILQQDLAREYAKEFVQRVSPRHSQQSPRYGGFQKSVKPVEAVEQKDHFSVGEGFDSTFGEAQEVMFHAEFGPESQFTKNADFRRELDNEVPSTSIPHFQPKKNTQNLRISYDGAATARLAPQRSASKSLATEFERTVPESPTAEVEEKKDDEESSVMVGGKSNGLKSKWQQWESQSDRTMHTVPSQPAPKWKRNSQGSQHSALSGVEMLTPDMVEARRQEKRKNRLEELRKANQDASAANGSARSTPASQQRAHECQDERSSFASLRERLKPTAVSKAKSDVGARSSFSSSVVDRLRQESPRPSMSDAKSDVGSSPSFLAGVKLRKTGANLSDRTSLESSLAPKSLGSGAPMDEPPIEDSFATVVRDAAPGRKLTYRERREMELKKEQEEKSKQPLAKKEEPKMDVAALIRKRIAANKQKKSMSENPAAGSSSLAQFRNNLKPVTPLSGPTPNEKIAAQQPSPTKRHEQPQYPPRSEEPPKFAPPNVNTQFNHDDEPVGSALLDNFSPASGATNLTYSTDNSQPRNIVSLGSKSPRTQSYARDTSKLNNMGEERYATSNRLEALLSKKVEEPMDASTHSGTSSVPKPVNKPAFEPPADGAAGKNDVKAMLSGFLGARMNPLASLPAPKKEDDAEAIKELKSFESQHSPREKQPETKTPPPPPSAGSNGKRPALKEDPKYERYFRMLKVGMPMEVVKHAMQKDGCDPSVMDGDHNLPVGLPLKEDPKYTKYFKMMKMGITMPQVKHAMEMDGLNPDVMDQDHNLPATACEKRSSVEPKEKDTKRRARLHWKTLRKITRNSLWSKIEKEPEVTNIDFDEDEFQELFQAELGPAVKSPKNIGTTRKKGAAVRVIDAKRANNGGIILARVKMSHDEMADAVDKIDGDALTAEQIENIIEYLPTKEERIQLEKYMLEGGQDAAEKFDGLCECEKFMVSMMTVKHAKRKVNALLFKLQFIGCLQSIAEDTQLIDDACDELKHSTRLRQLLGIVLQFGNRLNTAGKSKQNKAGAFTLDSLLKLSQAKAFDKKTTFLHYLVMIVHRNNELLLKFTDDLPTCLKADKIYWDQCLQDLEEVENQLENVRRISLHEARTKKYGLKNRKKNDDEDSIGDLDLSLEEEVEALRASPTGLFTLSAIKQVSALRDKVEATRKKFVAVLEYFGEDKDSMQPHELFHIFCVFGRDFNKAKDEAFATLKRKQREDRKKAGKNQHPPKAMNGIKGKPPSVPERKTLRASNMQPHMNKVINDFRSPPRQPAVRPDQSTKLHTSQPTHSWSGQYLPQQSTAPDARRPVQPTRNEQLPYDYRYKHNESSRVSTVQLGPAAIPDAPIPRGMQESAQFQNISSTHAAASPSAPATRELSAAESLRQKAARNRRQRMQVVTGRSTPIGSSNSIPESRSPRSSPMSSPEEESAAPNMGNAAASSSPSPLSSRAAMRHRRMQAMKRINANKSQARNDWGTSSQVSTN